MGAILPILIVVALGLAWQHGVRDWTALAIVAVVGPVAALTLLTALWTAIQPIGPALLAVVAVGAGVAVAFGNTADKPPTRQQQSQRELPPEAPKTSKKRRIDAD